MNASIKHIDWATDSLKNSVHLLIDATVRHAQKPNESSKQDQANAYEGIMGEIRIIKKYAYLLGDNDCALPASNVDLPVPHRISA